MQKLLWFSVHTPGRTAKTKRTARTRPPVYQQKRTAPRAFLKTKTTDACGRGQALVPVHYSKRKPPRQIFGFKPPFFYTIGNILRGFFLFCHPVQTLRARFATAADIACFPLCKP